MDPSALIRFSEYEKFFQHFATLIRREFGVKEVVLDAEFHFRFGR